MVNLKIGGVERDVRVNEVGLRAEVRYYIIVGLVVCLVSIWSVVRADTGADVKTDTVADVEAGGDDWGDDDDSLYDDDAEPVADPLEKFNRAMTGLNNVLDKCFIAPIAVAYKHVAPNVVQKGVDNFTSNFFAPVTTVNYILQGNGERVVKTVFRFVINTLFGFFGVVDVAEKMKLDRQNTSLGDTFKRWGMKPGPYVVLPLLGPGSMRSSFGSIIQIPVDQIAQVSLLKYRRSPRRKLFYAISALKVIDKRAQLHQLLTEIEKTSKDPYVTTRNAVMSLEK
ncbi:MAG: VacJ family lipoprotein [Holosporales bacterium]|jgi:phospholipid-binding lipoprotein MlaA|nr:VacJ family lipoprotein [Holosporales bacterium]